MNELVELSNLSERDASALLDRLIALDSRIFRYPSEEERERFQLRMRDVSQAGKMLVLYEDAGAPIGYNLIEIERLESHDRVVWVVGSAAGFLPGHASSGRAMTDAIQAMVRHNLGHPGRAYFLVSFLASPGSYDLLADLSPATFPSLHRPPTHGFEAELIAAEAQRLGLPILANDRGRLISSGRVPRAPFEPRRESAHVRFFEQLNPRHAEGEMLGVCVPLGMGHLLGGAARLLGRRFWSALT